MILVLSVYTHKPSLKGTATLMISMFYQKELFEPRILIQVPSKSVEKHGSNGHLKNSMWPTCSRHFEHLIIFHNFYKMLMRSFIYKGYVLLKINANNLLVCLLFGLHIFN